MTPLVSGTALIVHHFKSFYTFGMATEDDRAHAWNGLSNQKVSRARAALHKIRAKVGFPRKKNTWFSLRKQMTKISSLASVSGHCPDGSQKVGLSGQKVHLALQRDDIEGMDHSKAHKGSLPPLSRQRKTALLESGFSVAQTLEIETPSDSAD
jgi:hypothetical protein